MNEHTQRIIEKIKQLFIDFRNQKISLAELQAGLSGVAMAIDGAIGSHIGKSLNKLEADLEHIQFMSQEEDQFDAALNRIRKEEELFGPWAG